MESPNESKIGDGSTSDVVVRLRTQDGRDDRVYCHSHVLTEKSQYFAERLSDKWPTCQIIDSRNCVEVHCQESDYDDHINYLRLLYVDVDASLHEYRVESTLGILQVAVALGSPHIVNACVNYLEALPWDEGEEDKILRIIPSMGEKAEPVLARLQPVNASYIWRIFMSTVQFVTSSPHYLIDLRTSAQEQLDYMLTEDDDAPMIVADDKIRSKVKECVKRLFTRFRELLAAMLREPVESIYDFSKMHLLQSNLSDLSWAYQILNKLEIILVEFVSYWVDESHNIMEVLERAKSTDGLMFLKSKVIEVAAKALEPIGYGTVIFPPEKRLEIVKIWVPFVRDTKPLIESVTTNEEIAPALRRTDEEVWTSLEYTFVNVVQTLPSEYQAEILQEWLDNEHVDYPDFTEAFEMWCFRCKTAQRRLAGILGNKNGAVDT